MTWRGLSRRLLTGSFLIVALVWMFASTHRTRYTFGTETRQLGISLLSGSLELHSAPQPETGRRLEPWFEFLRLSGRFRCSWGHLSYSVTPVAEDRRWQVQVPVWALWFPIAGFILAFCRIMEKRSGSGNDKKPAGGSDGTDEAISDIDAFFPADAHHADPGRAADGLLAIAAVLLLTAFFTGGYWPLLIISSAFAIWGLREATTTRQRVTGNILTTLCVTCVAFGYVVGMTTRY